jgi:hypothetical protein
MSWSNIIRIEDPLQCRTAIRGSDVEVFPRKRGKFELEITQIGFDQLWMGRFQVSLPQVNALAVKPGRIPIMFLTEPDEPPIQHCGLEVAPGDIIVNRTDVVHQRSEANLSLGSMSLPADKMNAALEAVIGHDFLEKLSKSVVRPGSALMLRLLKLHTAIGGAGS